MNRPFLKSPHAIGRFVALLGILDFLFNPRLQRLEFRARRLGCPPFLDTFRCLDHSTQSHRLSAASHCSIRNANSFRNILPRQLGRH
jgi:hypothetical protein